MTQPFVAFPCSSALRSETEKLIINLSAGVSEPQNRLAMQTVDLLIEDLLAGFLLNLIDVLEMKNFMAKLVRSTAGTINKAGSSVANASLKKMDNKQMRPMADHVASLMLDLQVDDEIQPWMGVPVDDALSSEIAELIDGLRSDNPKAYVPMAMDVLEKLTEQAADVYIFQSVQLLQVGMVLQRRHFCGEGRHAHDEQENPAGSGRRAITCPGRLYRRHPYHGGRAGEGTGAGIGLNARRRAKA